MVLGLLVAVLGLGRPRKMSIRLRQVFDDILVPAVTDLVAPEDRFYRRATGEVGHDGYLDLRHRQSSPGDSLVGRVGDRFRRAGQFRLGQLL